MPRKSNGRLLDLWRIHIAGINHRVEVRYIPADGKETFRAFIPVKGGGFHAIDNSNLKHLRTAVEKYMEGNTRLEWKPKLVVKLSAKVDNRGAKHVNGNMILDEWCGYLNIEVDLVELATDDTGKKWQRGGCQSHSLPDWPEEGVQKGDFAGEPDELVTIIDDTPENRAAISAIIEVMSKLRDRMETIIGPGKLMDTIKRLQTNPGLLLLPEK